VHPGKGLKLAWPLVKELDGLEELEELEELAQPLVKELEELEELEELAHPLVQELKGLEEVEQLDVLEGLEALEDLEELAGLPELQGPEELAWQLVDVHPAAMASAQVMISAVVGHLSGVAFVARMGSCGLRLSKGPAKVRLAMA
jgi:hypothetical protein